MTDPGTATKARLDDLVNSYLDSTEAIDKWTTVKEETAAQLALALGVGNRHEIAPGVGVTVARPSRRFDPKLARQVLTAEQVAMISESVPSATLAAERLPGALVDLCKVSNGKPSVRKL